MLISGGLNVYRAEVERALAGIEGVAAVLARVGEVSQSNLARFKQLRHAVFPANAVALAC